MTADAGTPQTRTDSPDAGRGLVHRVTRLADQTERAAFRASGWAGVAGGWLAWLVASAAWGSSAWVLLPSFGVALVLVLPALVLWLFGVGLGQLRRVPEGVLTDTADFFRSLPDVQESAGRGGFRRLWGLVRGLLASRGALVAARDRLVAAGLLIRILHPVSLIGVLAALVVGALLVPVAAVAALVVLL